MSEGDGWNACRPRLAVWPDPTVLRVVEDAVTQMRIARNAMGTGPTFETEEYGKETYAWFMALDHELDLAIDSLERWLGPTQGEVQAQKTAAQITELWPPHCDPQPVRTIRAEDVAEVFRTVMHQLLRKESDVDG